MLKRKEEVTLTRSRTVPVTAGLSSNLFHVCLRLKLQKSCVSEARRTAVQLGFPRAAQPLCLLRDAGRAAICIYIDTRLDWFWRKPKTLS